MKKKGLLIGAIAGGAAVIAAGVIILVNVLGNKEESYRVIKVLTANGHSYVTREEVGEIESYEGMALQSGDTVRVDGNSTLTLIVDEDKVCYAEENTQFNLVAEGTSVSSKTKVYVDYGTLTWDVQNKLADDASFEIQTPNSTMAIRGTVPQVCVCSDPNKKYNTISKIKVFEGSVDITYFDKDGSELGTINLKGGKQIEIGTDDTKTEIISQSDTIDLSDISKSTADALLEILKTRGEKEMGFTEQEIKTVLSQISEADSYNVVFMDSNDRNNSKVFATQTVANGDLLQKPLLQPTENGRWDVDFSLKVSDNLIVYWIPQN